MLPIPWLFQRYQAKVASNLNKDLNGSESFSKYLKTSDFLIYRYKNLMLKRVDFTHLQQIWLYWQFDIANLTENLLVSRNEIASSLYSCTKRYGFRTLRKASHICLVGNQMLVTAYSLIVHWAKVLCVHQV